MITENPIRPDFLDQEIIDSYKLDMSALTPDKGEEFVNLAKRIEDIYKENYGEFIDATLPSVAERILFLDRRGMKRFYNITTTSVEQRKRSPFKNFKKQHIQAAANNSLGIIMFDTTANSWKKIDSDYKLDAKLWWGFRTRVSELEKKLKHDFDLHNLAHEIAHFYQDRSNSWIVRETGAYYYERIPAKNILDNPLGKNVNHVKRASFYDKLITKYGNDVHRMYFGSQMEEKKKSEILSEFTKEITDFLFPHGRL